MKPGAAMKRGPGGAPWKRESGAEKPGPGAAPWNPGAGPPGDPPLGNPPPRGPPAAAAMAAARPRVATARMMTTADRLILGPPREFPIWTQFHASRGVERGGNPPISFFATPEALTEADLGEDLPVCDAVLLSSPAPVAPFSETPPASTPAPLRRRSGCGACDQVGCHASRSMHPRICPNRRRVKRLSGQFATPAGS